MKSKMKKQAQIALMQAGLKPELLDASRAMDYVTHPSFKIPQTEQELFGPSEHEIKIHRWTHFPEVPEETNMPRASRDSLKPKQEQKIFLQYNYARYRLAQLAELQQKSPAPKTEKRMRTWYERTQKLRSDIVSTNMVLVLAMAKRTRIPNVEFTEIISEGNLALLRAVEKFDVSRGFKFSTYACRAILKSFNRLATKTGRYYERFPTEYDPEMEKSDEDQRRHKAQFEDSLEDLREVLEANEAGLSETEIKVVNERFALNSLHKPRTLAQVGELVGLTTERVRQIQFKALDKLKKAMNEHFTAA